MRTGMNRSTLATQKTMEQLGCYLQRWNSRTRMDVGAMLADSVIQATELFAVKMQAAMRGRRRIVCPSEQAEHFVAESTSVLPNFKVAQTAMLCPPRPWARTDSLISVPGVAPGMAPSQVSGRTSCMGTSSAGESSDAAVRHSKVTRSTTPEVFTVTI